MSREALHSNATDDHGTPPEFSALSREVFAVVGRGIDLDPFSSAYWNHHVTKATRIITERENGYASHWARYGERGITVQLNPPGPVKGRDETKRNVPNAWNLLCRHWRDGVVDCAVWIGYSLEQLQTLQSQATHPLQFITSILANRIGFMIRTPGNGPPERSKSPTHGNYITLLPTRRSPALAAQQIRVFVDGITNLQIGGHCVRTV